MADSHQVHDLKLLELPVSGMDCAECTRHVEHALAGVPGVASVQVLLSAEKAILRLDPAAVSMDQLRAAVADAGYSVPASTESAVASQHAGYTQKVWTVMALVFGAVIFVVVIGEWLGLFEQITERVPFVAGAALVLISGWPVFRNVARATWRRQITSHTLMAIGVVAALAVGQWTTAAVVVFFMRIGDYVERFTAESARQAVRNLSAMAPQQARVVREGIELEVRVADVQPGEIVVVRPGEKIAVDGIVVDGHATINQAAITGESLPVEAGAGTHVFAATVAQFGSLRVRTERTGSDTTFGRVIKLVEEAEANRADVQRFADKFSGYYLPVVLAIALLTLLLRGDPLAMAAVLVVACSCAIALATPVAMLAAIGNAARQGLLIKGGKAIELLARADVLLIDKTGTLTLGRPHIEEVIAFNGMSPKDVLGLAASAERYSEHPLADAVRIRAVEEGLTLHEPAHFSAVPGKGVVADVAGRRVTVGSNLLTPAALPAVDRAKVQGKSVLWVSCDGEIVGLLTAGDTMRAEIPAALQQVRAMGVTTIEVLTGDHAAAAESLAQELGVVYRADLLPEDKIAVVKAYQAQGRVVVMVGDGVNDAPALAQADVGIAMGAAGSDVAMEAAQIALMRDDWQLAPAVFALAKRTMRVVKMNLFLTAVYNVVGISLAALGILPPILAAAAQSIPDLLIVGNSARLLKNRRE